MLQQIVFCWATYSSYPRCMFSQKCAGIFVTLSKATAMSEVTLLLPPMTTKMVFSGFEVRTANMLFVNKESFSMQVC